MNEFLKKSLEHNSKRKIVLRDYDSADGYTVKNCPYITSVYGLFPDGSDVAIPSNVLYRILEIIQEMREKGIYECEYY